MLLGTYEHSLDSKNRLTLPSGIRKNFDTFVVLSIGIDKCAEIRTPEEFKSYTSMLQKVGISKEKYRTLLRTVLGNSFEIQIDSSNRVLVPGIIAEFCNFSKNVVLIGVGDKMEVWSADIYNSIKRKDDINALSSVVESLNDLDDN
ncbi:MAG: division/cell wall cluster transcriptional repressor MraZ [Candidatus Ureaplasma intestinipullorum]|uniref:Transcriptional regulator MraZ n=1 Tax=Candidatus Ureaplasma intestinipullorum TaxID=2838770 RepID=A0A9E2KWB4_9BACT|nr:division/cell wall cluster transcriptional repressor MraZ [Candidatus Ureaplasma intestinipullorum]